MAALVASDAEDMLNHIRFHDGSGKTSGSLLDYGLRCYSGRSVDDAFMRSVAADIVTALRRFEPRLDPASIRIDPLEPAHRVRSRCRFALSAQLRSDDHDIAWCIHFDTKFGTIRIDRGVAVADGRLG
ncbi:GPW/gp25 family protein [Sphingomonas sp. NPDC079357]|uniref:GPW/gp25 family protein n=1 Tax=Sphingomonas sp. NPDC079357 TaxID=3364518 RepID=UPI00385157E5